MRDERVTAGRRAWPTVLVYTLAATGGIVGYLPLLTLLLPIKVQAATPDRIGVLAACAIAGAVAAGMANILFGWLSDRSVERGRGRRGWLVFGTVATLASYAAIAASTTSVSIVVSMVAFQIAINAVLAPAGALMADEIPDALKGVTAGWQTLGVPVAFGVSALVVGVASDEGSRLAIVALILIAGILPLILLPPRSVVEPGPSAAPPTPQRHDLIVAWGARLLAQIAGCGVGLYLLYYLEALTGDQAGTPAAVARLLVVGAILPVPLAVALGRWSDRSGRRKPFLLGSALLTAAGLVTMASARSWAPAASGYVIFAIGIAIFLALNTGLAMQLLPTPHRRGRDLGLLNLANTVPSIIAPLLAWWLATATDFAAVMLVLAALTVAAGVSMLAICGSA